VERLKSARKITVGTKQTEKAVEKNQARVVYVARDAEERVSAALLKMCADKGIEVVYVNSMSDLGAICGIKVKAASAAVIE
jgi:large subunit ribosomal protein L7A